MKTSHRIILGDARQLRLIEDDSVEFIVTSPPYPMIEMWDSLFAGLSPAIGDALGRENGWKAFGLMHDELDKAWKECLRVLRPGCIACINIGDAVRTIGGSFSLYPNHSRIVQCMVNLGFTPLPDILWRKQTNAPNKFMGSGMLPACAYVTYEHEYILIFRKGEKRTFGKGMEEENRRKSAYFWEERNLWFSDVWMDLKGASQPLGDKAARERSAAFPFELAYRLIGMHSIYGDTVLDPFLGTGTSTAASIALSRNSIGVDLEKGLGNRIEETIRSSLRIGKEKTLDRLSRHREFVSVRIDSGKKIKHRNENHGFQVMTSQETDITMYIPKRLTKKPDNLYEVDAEVATPETESLREQLGLFGA